MARIILLGASGFIGSNLLLELKKQNYEIKAMINKKKLSITVPNFSGNILTPKILDRVLKKDDIVINLIGQISKNHKNFIQTNILGSINLLDSCYRKKVKKIIFLSSINVYGENTKSPSLETDSLKPLTTYGHVKMLSEELYKSYAKTYDLNIILLRLSNVYGPKKKLGFISNLINSINNKKIKNIAFNDGKQYRDLLFIDDVIIGIMSSLKNSRKGFHIYNLCSGKRYSVKNIIKIIEKLSSKQVNVKFSDIIPDEKCIWGDNSKANKLLNFSPTVNLIDGLFITIQKS
jgi:nucleoside-diphosphate-sugar epimerase